MGEIIWSSGVLGWEGCLPGYAPPLLSFVEIDDNFSCATKRSVQTMRWKTPEFVSAPPRCHSTERRKSALAIFCLLWFAPINLQADCATMRQWQGKYLGMGLHEIVWKTPGLNWKLSFGFITWRMQLAQHHITPSYKVPSSKSNEEAEQDIEHFPPLRPSPCGHYLRKKCRQAKKAGARRARFALCGKTAVSSRTTAMDGSGATISPQKTLKPRSHINTRK